MLSLEEMWRRWEGYKLGSDGPPGRNLDRPQETDIIDDDEGIGPVQKANAGSPSKPNGIEIPKPHRTLSIAST
jgi:hypothetical protein